MIMLVHFRLVSRKYILNIQLQFCRDLVTIIVIPGFGSSGVYYTFLGVATYTGEVVTEELVKTEQPLYVGVGSYYFTNCVVYKCSHSHYNLKC